MIIKYKESFKTLNKLVIYIILWFSILFIYIIIELPNFSFGNYLYYLLYFFPMILFVFIQKANITYNYKKIKKWIIIIFLITIISNIYMLSENEYAAKELTGGYGEVAILKNSNMVTDINMIAIILFTYYLFVKINNSNGKTKLLYICLLVISIIMIIMTTFFISIITLLIILLFDYMFCGNSKDKIIKIIIMTIICILFIFTKNNIANHIKEYSENNIDNYIVRQRLMSLSEIILGEDIKGSLRARFNDISISFNTFLRYPIFGKGFLISNNIYDTGIGMHSFFVDDLARFGIVGISIEIYIHIQFFKYVKQYINNIYKINYFVAIIGAIFYGMFNPIIYPQTGLMLFLILPIMLNSIEIQNEGEKLK